MTLMTRALLGEINLLSGAIVCQLLCVSFVSLLTTHLEAQTHTHYPLMPRVI